MNLLILFVFLFMLAAALALFTGIFLYACRLAKLPSPGFAKAALVVVTTAVIWAIIEGAFVAALHRIYAALGGPPWEVWLVGLFAGFPASLAAGTILHRTLMKVPVGKAIEVWFFERLIRYSFLCAGAAALAAGWLAMK